VKALESEVSLKQMLKGLYQNGPNHLPWTDS
jgi:hypothetical protein